MLDDGAPDGLICPASAIFDASAVVAQINDAIAEATSEKAIRAATVKVLAEARQAGMAQIASAFRAQPFASRPTTRAYSWLTDQIVTTVLNVAMGHLHPRPNPTEGERLSLIAVGGYGRGEMAPQSDVDLLFLTPYKITPWAESVIESMLYMLWDLKLKVGHASRTVKDCLRLAKCRYSTNDVR
ncbi:MAG: nucleotidyltransferase domain-containing protein, partial [Pseudomonadota bacterium]